ncbi:MAG: hypothetical protein AMXMBFR33_59190 [Candidatus Xenobia bacterium]
MKAGLYEQLLSRRLARQLDNVPHQARPVDPAEAPRILARHLAQVLTRLLSTTEHNERARTVNEILILLADEEDLVDNQLRELLAVLPPSLLSHEPERPGVPLSVTELLVNARGEHRIGVEILRELQSADRVDLLCSFLKWSGFRIVREDLERFQARGGQLRVLTTCYLGATDLEVLEALSPIAEIKVSYDTRRTRLHAKAWLFHRNSGFSTGYIGSSNLSSAALLDGLEWNVRVSHVDNPRVLEKFQATFDSYWEDGEFEPFEASRFATATRREQSEPAVQLFTLDVKPYPYQEDILQQLEAARELKGRWRNLIVAATGTGKTVMAALDYRRTRQRWCRARLLFVAHREEILDQSMTTFRAVLRDGSFGEKWTGRSKPTQEEHLFASVQKLANLELTTLPADHFDVIVIDEFHHAAAPTYRRIIQHFQPRLLLGLTATPERTDGQSVTTVLGAEVTAELRLWDALERGLLSPFQYFGLHDNTDLRQTEWRRGAYQNLDGVYTGDQARARLVLHQVRHHVLDMRRMRALGFCAGTGHARFMAEEFNRVGLAAVAVLGDTPGEERRQAVLDLRHNRICAIFAVDVFNEGLDVPEVDTVLLLRPTESATIFLQQLGRGLRLAEGKECLTVLDFIGMARQEFRFDLLYTAVLGGTRKELVQQLEQGFPLLPSGCSMQLDRQAMRIVLENLRGQIRTTRSFLRTELNRVGLQATLTEFLQRTGIELDQLYGPGWVGLRREAGVEGPVVRSGVGRPESLQGPGRQPFLARLLALELRPQPPIEVFHVGAAVEDRHALLAFLQLLAQHLHDLLVAGRDESGPAHLGHLLLHADQVVGHETPHPQLVLRVDVARHEPDVQRGRGPDVQRHRRLQAGLHHLEEDVAARLPALLHPLSDLGVRQIGVDHVRGEVVDLLKLEGQAEEVADLLLRSG